MYRFLIVLLSNSQIQKTGLQSGSSPHQVLPASDLERWVEWKRRLLQHEIVTWR
jgi:hypothetical protein